MRFSTIEVSTQGTDLHFQVVCDPEAGGTALAQRELQRLVSERTSARKVAGEHYRSASCRQPKNELREGSALLRNGGGTVSRIDNLDRTSASFCD